MAPSFIEALQDAALAWGVPAAYATCCIVAHRLTAPKEIRVPDHLEPTHEAPPLHPLLLGALWFRKESELHNVENACEVTLAVVVRMIGRGLASFVESERSGPEAPKAAGASRREGLFSRLTQNMPLYSTQLQLTVSTEHLDRYDRDACELVLPPRTRSANMEELCTYARDVGQHYNGLGVILSERTSDLYAAELVRTPGNFYSFLFSPVISFLVGIWALIGFMFIGIEPSMPVIAAQFVFAMAIFIIRFAKVDVGARITPTGAQILAQAQATIRWARAAVKGDASVPHDLTSIDIADLLATLLATGNHDLATDIAGVLLRSGYGSRDDMPEAQQALAFCARRTLADSVPQLKHEKSPVELILDNLHETVLMLERSGDI